MTPVPTPDMETIQVNVANGSYPVYIGSGILTDGSLWEPYLGRAKALIVSNDVVAPLYLEKLRSSLPKDSAAVHIIPDGEIHKNSETWKGIIDHLVDINARRDDIVIALGGGVVGDIAGFAAASYMRGIRFLQVPTTLLAQVDASVGGKTGINHAKGKNLIGAFHQPAAVVIDPATLTTLPEREFNAGLAEVVKYGAIMDGEFFDWLEASTQKIRAREAKTLHHLIRQSVSDKAAIVSADEREAGIRALLNFGHSFAHALETVTAYREFLHGEAVAIGMVIAAQLSELRGLCSYGAKDRLARLLQRFDLALELPRTVSTGALIEAIELDKKGLAGARRLILLNAVGEALIDDQSTDEQIAAAIDHCR
jgi:3-dehydroquinate synthase